MLNAVILFLALVPCHALRRCRHVEDLREIQSLRLPMLNPAACIEQVGAANQIIELPNAHLRHQFAQLFGNEEEIIDNMFGLTSKSFTQHRVLRCHTHRTGVEVALTHHDATFDDQWRSSKAKFVSPEQRTDKYVAPSLHLTIGLHANAATQSIQNQGLLRLRQTQLPRRTGMFNG